MAFVLIALGLAVGYLDYLGYPNVQSAGSLLKAEMFTDNPPFYKWIGAIIIVAAIGYIPEMEPIATAFLVLIILAILLSASHQNGITNLIKAL